MDVLASLSAFWDGRDVQHLHHPVWFRQFGDDALVARDPAGALAGYLLAHCTPSLAYIHVVSVHPTFRGQGVARSLYDRLLAEAGRQGTERVEAITTPTNEVSVEFHLRLGFAAERVIDYAGPGEDRVVFRRFVHTP